jgi:hypothetical protein
MDTAPGMGPARQSDQKTRGDNLWPAKQTSKEETLYGNSGNADPRRFRGTPE